MITVKLSLEDGSYRAVSNGHAGWCNGNDIVCASVSTIMFTLMGAIENLCSVGAREIEVEDGRISLSCEPKSEEDLIAAELLFDAAQIGILQLQAEYPGYVRLEE